ncbi:MatE efflux family protein [Oscillibacter valericigenes Sjm18-20]|nr:MatE efflux family protein [Oscillibacter valericigenes Sjm18-20]
MGQPSQKTEIFERMPVKRAVLTQIAPAIAGQMITLIYSLADTYFVGMLNSSAATAAITVAFPMFLMLTAISNLFGVGGASAIARALGKKNPEKARRIAGISFWSGLAAGVLYSLAFLLFGKPVLRLCGATESTFDIALGYARWVIMIGGPFTILNMLLANLVRAEGSAMHASIGVSMGGILNTVLDPVFVLPQFLGFGAVGAGIATAISNAAAMGYFIFYALGKKGDATVVSLAPRNLRHTREYIKEILAVGFPSAIQFALTVVAISVQAKFVSKYATEAVAGLGIVKKLDQLPLYFTMGVSNGLLPLLGYNYSVGNQERRKQAFRFGCMISLGFSIFCLVIYEVFAPALARFFIEDPATVQYAANFLRRMVTAMPMMSLCYPIIIQFQAMGKARPALVCSIIRKGVLDIPVSFLMDALVPLYGLMWVQPIVDTVSLCVAAVLYKRQNC